MPIDVQLQRAPGLSDRTREWIVQAVRTIANDYGWEDGQVSIAVVDDALIHEVNQRFLKHDYPTDVISFDLTENNSYLEGDMIVSLETAQRVASENGWKSSQEVLLYVIHGMLHIIGLDDDTPAHIRRMRSNERYYLELLSGDSRPCGSMSRQVRSRG